MGYVVRVEPAQMFHEILEHRWYLEGGKRDLWNYILRPGITFVSILPARNAPIQEEAVVVVNSLPRNFGSAIDLAP
jgi:hypothetical protein